MILKFLSHFTTFTLLLFQLKVLITALFHVKFVYLLASAIMLYLLGSYLLKVSPKEETLTIF